MSTWNIHEGDCIEQMRAMPEDSIDAVVCDPPYNLTFMGKPWDCHDGQEDAGFAYWLAGLIDGEGHFAIKEHTRGTHAPAFTLKMRGDEMGTLEFVKRTLRIGALSLEKRDGNPMAKWTVQNKEDCQQLVDLLDKYPLRAKKRIDYATWREAVCEWTNRPRGNRWHGAADNTRMAELREHLMSARKYAEPAWSGNEFQDWCRLWGREAFRVLKPGGHLLASGGTRTSHRLAAGIEDAGFEIRDSLIWIYGSGFPKSLDVGKAIDAAAGAERTKSAGVKPGHEDFADRTDAHSAGGRSEGWDRDWRSDPEAVRRSHMKFAPATPEAEVWDGWGTALKPGHEPIVVARKPLVGTVAANILQYGTGGLNVDDCRITADSSQRVGGKADAGGCPVHGLRGVRQEDQGPVADRVRSPADRSAESRGQGAAADADAKGSAGAPSGAAAGGEPGSADHRPVRCTCVPRGRVGESSADRRYIENGSVNFAATPGPRGGASNGRWPANLILSHAEDCVCVGERQVRTPATYVRQADSENKSAYSSGVGEKAGTTSQNYGDEDGLETVEAWECAPGCPVAELDAQTGTLRSGTAVGGLRRMSNKHTSVYGHFAGMQSEGDVTYGDTGGASRFFYCAKASRAERNVGLIAANIHPTVKPIDLMRWLVRLVTPPGGTVLDPFTGSGTTGCAAVLEGFDFIGCERQGPEWKREHPEADDYVAIASARIAWWSEHPEGIETSRVFAADKRRAETAATGQGGLF